MRKVPILFDAVVFDLDGTLVATDRFWVDAARAGARRAFEELGLERELPSSAEWMSLVGLPLRAGFERLFADLQPRQLELVLERCVEEEQRALAAGQAALLPGVAQTLEELAQRGLRLGIASNCGREYLRSMMEGLGLRRWVHEARCLDTPGMRSKSAMVADLLAAFGTRAAVMVGDRQGDRDAAWENGLPHVHCARGFAPLGEDLECEAVIEEMGALVPLLEARSHAMDATLTRLGFFEEQPPRSLGVTGHSGSGKSLFARDAARWLAHRGRAAVVLALDEFLKGETGQAELTQTAFWPAQRPLDHLPQGFDVEDLVRGVLEPHALGKAVDHARGAARIQLAPSDVLVLHGLFLSHPALRPHLDRLVHLEASENLCLRRVAGRDARHGPETLLRIRRHFLPAQRAFDEALPPARHADLLLPAENPLA